MKQATLVAPVEFSGVGIHTGEAGHIRVQPAAPGHGIQFRSGGVTFPAEVGQVVSCQRCTTLGRQGVTVSTVEHLLAAAVGVGLSNLLIEVEGPEIPILDGSSAPFVEAFQRVGVQDQGQSLEPLVLRRPIWVENGGSVLVARPCDYLHLEVVLHYDHPMLGCQQVEFRSGQSFAEELAPCRTFALWEEVQHLQARGLARGGDLSNALVVFPDHYSLPLRRPQEMARHKCLDLLGDLSLLGRPLQARVLAVKAGHSSHVELVRRLKLEVNDDAQRLRDQEADTPPVPFPSS